MSMFGKFKGLFGYAYQEQISATSDRSNVLFLLPADSRFYLNNFTRTRILQKTEWLRQNFGIVKEGGNGIARHTIGKGICLQIDSEDIDANRYMEEDFEEYAITPDRCDLAGRRNFYEAQATVLESRLFRGEAFAVDCFNKRWNGEPCFQLWDSNEVVTPDGGTPDSGVIDGVKLDADFCPVEYYVRTFGQVAKPVPASAMMHWYKPEQINQVRGVSEFAQAVNPLVDIHELKKLATKSAKLHQALAVVVKKTAKLGRKGAFAAIRNAPGANGCAPSTSEGQDTTALESIYGGASIAYVGDDGDVKLVSGNSPSPLVETFITDLLMRDVCAGWGVPAEFFWSIAKLSGANTRFVLSKADLFFQIIGDALIYRFCRRHAYRFLQFRIQNGLLKAPQDKAGNPLPWKMSWQTPARITIDSGRDSATDIARLANGLLTLRQYYNERGQDYRRALAQWFREWKEAKQIADEIGVPEVYRLFRASMPGAAGAAPREQDKSEDPPEDPNEADPGKQAAA